MARSELRNELKNELLKLMREVSYREGSFVLASGKTSSFYVDIKNTSLHPKGAHLIAQLGWEAIKNHKVNFNGVGGPTLGADPLATAISLWAQLQNHFLPAFIIRKEPKKHGTGEWIEGKENLAANGNLLVLEDVVTTAKTSLQSIEKVREAGFNISHLLCVLDRNEGGREKLKDHGVELIALTTIDELQNFR